MNRAGPPCDGLRCTCLCCRWNPFAETPEALEGQHANDLPALHRLLGDVPLWLLEPARKHWDALQSMGLRTLSDLRSLPRSGLARRFGEPLLDAVDRARGARPDPREFIVLPERFGLSFVHALTPPSRYCMARPSWSPAWLPGHQPGMRRCAATRCACNMSCVIDVMLMSSPRPVGTHDDPTDA
jgi:hypothetical protein